MPTRAHDILEAFAHEMPDAMSTDELALWLGVDIRDVAGWRRLGTGPAFEPMRGRRPITYRRDDVIAWLEDRGYGLPPRNFTK